ncbi:MAG TPA: DnaA N-terminal domain-containing protein [Anaerolineales bacterium]|nr:DnaA N-terminal domain-containing protein [Anaerolineales bacterium]
MTLPTPPRYVVIPQDKIDQAFAPDKPRRALLGTFVRILSLAWESKYEKTPRMQESELIAFLKLSRRQFFEQKADMELLGWLRSTHPVPGFVQFIFSSPIAEVIPSSAKNRQPMRKTALDDLKRIEDSDSPELKDSESSSSSTGSPVRKTALTASEQKMRLLVENLRLLFDPLDYGLLEWRETFLAGIPERALGWIAKAYQDRKRLQAPIGLIVKHIIAQDEPDSHFLNCFVEILPEKYLEAVGEFQYLCGYCDQRFSRRSELESHMAEEHPQPDEPVPSRPQDPLRTVQPDDSVTTPIDDGLTAEQAWQAVLGQLQMEMTRGTFETWMRDTKAIRYDGNRLEICTPNVNARDWLENRIQKMAERLLVGILAQEVTVQFVVSDGVAA